MALRIAPVLMAALLGCGRVHFDSQSDASADAPLPIDVGTSDAPLPRDAFRPDGRPPQDAGPSDAGGTDASLLDSVVQVSLGIGTVCGRTTSGVVHCTGCNDNLGLGVGSTDVGFSTSTPLPISAERATHVAHGDLHGCLVSSGQVFCWGWNFASQLGDGGTEDQASPVPMVGTSGIGRLVLGRSATCVIPSDRTLHCLGDNLFGQLGDGTRTARPMLAPVTGLTSVSDAAASETHACAIHEGGLSCWGLGTDGKLGDGAFVMYQTVPNTVALPGAVDVGVGYSHSCAVDDAGDAYCWGQNEFGQLGDGTTTPRPTPTRVTALTGATEIVGSELNTCALTGGGDVYCWGAAFDGTVGDGQTTTDRLRPVRVGTIEDAIAIASNPSGATMCVLRSRGRVSCWGASFCGKLGTTNTREPSPVDWPLPETAAIP